MTLFIIFITLMEGELEKWTNYISRWKVRYCVLKGEIFYYYNQRGEQAKGKVHLSLGKIEDNDKDGTTFQIDTGVGIYYLRAEDKEIKLNWLSALRKSKLNADRHSRHQDKVVVEEVNQEQVLPENVNLPERILFLKQFALKVDLNNTNLYKYITSSYDLGDDEQSKHLLEMLSNNKNDSKLFTQEFKVLIKKLEDLAISINSIQSYLNNKIPTSSFKSNNSSGSSVNYEESGLKVRATPNIINIVDNNEKESKIENKKPIEFFDVDEHSEDEIKRKNTQKSNKIEKKTNSSKFYDIAYYNTVKRIRLEKPRIEVNVNVWSILKDAIGKDLNKFCVPVYFNEPISMLQRLCENFQYADLLNKAAKETDPFLRIAYIAAYNIGGHAIHPLRTLKFFNPLLGETFEYVDLDMSFRFFAEQVSHHPAISACYVEGENWDFYSNSNSKHGFLLTKGAFEVRNIGRSFINIKSFNEQYSYTRPKVLVRNIIMGTMIVDVLDTFQVNNHNTGDTCEITYFPMNEPKNGDHGVFKGVIRDYLEVEKIKIEGNWQSHMDIIYKGERKRIWTKDNTDTYENYYFTNFSSNLNNISEELKSTLPPTDSRLRPDQRALENHNLELAANEKNRLEENQRARRKENEKKKNYKSLPVYFRETYDDLTGELIYEFNGKYWEDRKNKNYSNLIEIFK